jgi:hypothetical protein
MSIPATAQREEQVSRRQLISIHQCEPNQIDSRALINHRTATQDGASKVWLCFDFDTGSFFQRFD